MRTRDGLILMLLLLRLLILHSNTPASLPLLRLVVVSDHDFAAAKACGPCDRDQRADPPPASSFLSCP